METEQLKDQLLKISTELELLKAKDIRDLKDGIRLLASKIDRLTSQGNQSESIDKLATALAASKPNVKELMASGTGNSGTYSTFDDYRYSFEEALATEGLSMVFTPQRIGASEWILTTDLVHSSGQWKRSTLPIEISDNANSRQNDDQKLGSAISYMKRYAYAAMMGV